MTQQAAWPEDFPKLCDYRARCYVNGSARHEKTGKIEPISGAWSIHFKRHPWVIAAEAEGWGRELRAHVIFAVKRRLMRGQDFGDIEALMPDKGWIEYAKQQAERAAAAKEWRDSVVAEYGSMENYLHKQKPGGSPFEHRGRGHKPVANSVSKVLSDISKRMTGESEDESITSRMVGEQSA